MEITWNFSRSKWFTLCCKGGFTKNHLVESVKSSGTLKVFVRKHTKTSLGFDLASGDPDQPYMLRCQLNDNKHKFLITPEHTNGLGFRVPDKYYFKVTKKQGAEELKNYLTYIITDVLRIDIEKLNVQVTFHDTAQMNIDIAEALVNS